MKWWWMLGVLWLPLGCDDDPPSVDVGDVSGGDPVDHPVTPEDRPIEIYERDNPCFSGSASLYVKHNTIQIGPEDFTSDTGFVAVWSICSTGAITSASTPATNYKLQITTATDLEQKIVSDPAACPPTAPPFDCLQPPLATLARTVPPLPPGDGGGCFCHSEIILVNVPSGQQSQVLNPGVTPTGTFNAPLASGDRVYFYLSPPFFDDSSTSFPEGPTFRELVIP